MFAEAHSLFALCGTPVALVLAGIKNRPKFLASVTERLLLRKMRKLCGCPCYLQSAVGAHGEALLLKISFHLLHGESPEVKDAGGENGVGFALQ